MQRFPARAIPSRRPGASRRLPRGAVLPVAVLAALLLLAGCASSATLKRADAHATAGEWDNAITYYQQVLSEDPDNHEARNKLKLARSSASAFHRSEGAKLVRAGDLQAAQLELELAVRLDPANQQAVVDLGRVTEALESALAAADARRTPIEEAIDRAEAVSPPVPSIAHTARGLMTFDYRRAKLKEIYRALGRLGGINVILDPDIDNPTTSFFLADVTYENAWDVLTSTHGHFHRPIASNTLIVAPDDQNKRRQYEPQVLRTYYLSNADPEQVSGTLQSILGARQVAADATLNAVTIRDTADVVDVASHIVRALDKARGEVLLQIEIFEVNRGTMDDWGLSLSDYGTTLSVAQTPAGRSLGSLGDITDQDMFITIPSVRYQFLKQDSTFRVIAQPQLRASDGQPSSLLVGEQRPVVTTTFNPQNQSGGDVIPIATTEYRDVGIKILTTPRVHHDGMITLQLALEVTAVQENVGAQDQPVFTARTLETTLRLQEGETNVLAGLLRDDERTVLRGLPIFSDVPVLRKLFGHTQKEVTQTDIVLSITPRIVRMANIDEQDLVPIYVGTEAAISGSSTGRRAAGRGGNRGPGDDEDAGPGVPVEPLRVSLRPAEQSASVGQQITVDIDVQGGDAQVNNAGLRVGYDPRILEFVEAREGGLLGGDGAQTTFQAGAAAGGSVAVGIGRLGDAGGVLARGTLVTLTFEVVGAGESALQVISAAIRDERGRPLPLEFDQAIVRVSE